MFEEHSNHCRTKDCKGYPKCQGYCVTCYPRVYNKTSDGSIGVSGKPKLSMEQCKEIKRLSVAFKTKHEIAKLFGVNRKVITRVLNGTYKPNDLPKE